MALVTRPSMQDDDGTFTSGTVVDKALVDAVFDQTDDQCHSTTVPTRKPHETTEEVVAARGSRLTLTDRLDVTLNPDGTSKVSAAVPALGAATVNCVGNDDFRLWPDGDAAAPDYWTLSGAGASVARAGTGLGDTTRKVGDFCAKVTRSGADCKLVQTILSVAGFGRADFLKSGHYAAVGAWVWASVAGVAYVSVDDGVTVTRSAAHTGSSAWEFLAVTVAIGASATKLSAQLEVLTSDSTAYFSGATFHVMASNATLTDWQPCRTSVGFLQFNLSGAIANLTDARRSYIARSGIILSLDAVLKTAGTTVNLDVLTNTDTTPTYATALASTLAMGTAKFGGKAVDGTYARRCVRAGYGATPGVSSLVSIDISNVAGSPADGIVRVAILQYHRVFESFNDYNQ